MAANHPPAFNHEHDAALSFKLISEVPPPDMRDEERRREAEILKKASSEDLQKMLEQVSSPFCHSHIVS